MTEKPCYLCEGDGEVVKGLSLDSPEWHPEIIVCPSCNGTGIWRTTQMTEVCPDCKGR